MKDKEKWGQVLERINTLLINKVKSHLVILKFEQRKQALNFLKSL